MLNPDPTKLRYLGLDLHSRGRRRVIVALSWLVFFLGMSLFTYALDTQPLLESHPFAGFYLALLPVSLFLGGSVFRNGGAVKRFDFPVWRVRGRKEGGFVLLRDLDGWARYKHGAPLAELPEEQQQDVLSQYRVGYYLFPADKSKTPERLDEREVAVRNQASSNALQWLVFFCFGLAGAYAGRALPLRPTDIGMSLLMLGVFAFHAPRSIILWNEPDPRAGELVALERGEGSDSLPA